MPDPTTGISFSTSIERIENIPINGVVWKLPRNTLLPEGLVFNVSEKELDHPLLNASRKMATKEFIEKLDELSLKMHKTNVVIKNGKQVR